jgi:hypothetical protein
VKAGGHLHRPELIEGPSRASRRHWRATTTGREARATVSIPP